MLNEKNIKLLQHSITKILSLPGNGRDIHIEVSIHNTPNRYMDDAFEGSNLELQSSSYVDCIASDTSWICRARGTIQCGNSNNDMKVAFYPEWDDKE